LQIFRYDKEYIPALGKSSAALEIKDMQKKNKKHQLALENGSA
jgi:hypothetical protein